MASKLSRERLLSIRRQWLEALPTILFSLAVFFGILCLWGMSYLIFPSFITLLFRNRHTQDFRPKELLKDYLIMMLLCGASFLATCSLALCGLLNFVIPFLLVFLQTDKFNPKAYYVYTMEFVFLQLVPVSEEELPTQFLILTFCFALLAVSLFFYSRLIRRRRHFGTVRKGMKTASLVLGRLAAGEDYLEENDKFPDMILHMSRVIYSSRNYIHLADSYGKTNYYFMLLFQRLHYFVKQHASSGISLSPEDAAYFQRLSAIFAGAEQQINPADTHGLRQKIRYFLENSHLSSPREEDGMQNILELFFLALQEMEEMHLGHRTKEWQMPKDARPFPGAGQAKRLSLDLFELRFALRLSAVLCISFLFCRGTGLEHAYWYPMSAFLMLMPYAEESLMKVNNRILGTIGGLFIIFWLTMAFDSQAGHIGIIVAMTFLMYYAPITSWTMPMYTTCYALSLTTLSLDVPVAMGLRLLYVLMASATTLLANRFLLPNTTSGEFRKSVNELFDIDLRMLQEIYKKFDSESDLNIIRELIVRSGLVSQEIQNYIDGSMKREARLYYSQLLPVNRKLLSEMEQLYSFLHTGHVILSPEDNLILREVFQNMQDTIRRLRMSYTRNELTSFLTSGPEFRSFGKLDDRLYFNSLVTQCMDSVGQLASLGAKLPEV